MRALPDIYKAELTGWNEWQRDWVKNENNGKFEIQANFHFAIIVLMRIQFVFVSIFVSICAIICVQY